MTLPFQASNVNPTLMPFLLPCGVWALIFAFSKIPQPGKCLIQEAVFHVNKQEYLANHVVETKQAESELECGTHFVGKESCASANYKTSGVGKGLCELSSKPSRDEISKQLHKPEFNHLFIVPKVSVYLDCLILCLSAKCSR